MKLPGIKLEVLQNIIISHVQLLLSLHCMIYTEYRMYIKCIFINELHTFILAITKNGMSKKILILKTYPMKNYSIMEHKMWIYYCYLNMKIPIKEQLFWMFYYFWISFSKTTLQYTFINIKQKKIVHMPSAGR